MKQFYWAQQSNTYDISALKTFQGSTAKALSAEEAPYL